jgi:hypothetical protein
MAAERNHMHIKDSPLQKVGKEEETEDIYDAEAENVDEDTSPSEAGFMMGREQEPSKKTRKMQSATTKHRWS